jgi:glycerophosphoryl diester phosphodiesterase
MFLSHELFFLAKVKTLVITKYGASGDYPACTDLAYKKAKSDGADVIDCPVQLSKDGIPFCLSSIDLSTSTTVVDTKFRNRTAIIPEIQNGSGIYTFSLTWNEIKTLTRKLNDFLECLFLMYHIG